MGIWMPCVISAATLFKVETFGVDSRRPLPFRSSAVSATSRLNAPLIDPIVRPTALLAPGTGRLTAVPAGGTPVARVPGAVPVRAPLLGKARFVVLPSVGDTFPV